MQISGLSIAPLHHSSSLIYLRSSPVSFYPCFLLFAARISLEIPLQFALNSFVRFLLQIPELAQQTFLAGEIVEIRSLLAQLASALLALYNL